MKQTAYWIATILASVIICGGLAFAAEPIKVGVILPLTGDQAKFGEIERNSFLMALEEVNKAGGINGRPIELLIEGHCDERGTVEYNIALGEKRAESAKNYVVSLGASANKIKTVSYGKSKPLVQGVDEATWFQNRRAEFVITKK